MTKFDAICIISIKFYKCGHGVVDMGKSNITYKLLGLSFLRTLIQIISGCCIELGTSYLVESVLQVPFPIFTSVIFALCFFILCGFNKRRYPSWSLDNDLKCISYIISIFIVAFIDNLSFGIIEIIINNIMQNVIIIIFVFTLAFILLLLDILILDKLYERVRVDSFDAESEVNKWIRDFRKARSKSIIGILIAVVVVLTIITLLHVFNIIELWRYYRWLL